VAHLLEFRNVTKTYTRGYFADAGTTALQDFSMVLDEDSPTIMTVAGESGSGKTTIAMLLLGFIEPTKGEILYKGKNIKNLRGEERMNFRREVQAVFQDPFAVFNPFYTVDHLLTVPIERFKLAKSKADARNKMEEALSSVGLRPEDILGRFPHQLSGGQRQRINVARALLLKPKVLVADEPVSMVDASLRANILESLRGLHRDHGVSIVYITHDLTTAYHVANSIVVLYKGGVMEAGDVETVIQKPEHPYTKLLIDSIPWPELDRRWGSDGMMVKEADGSDKGAKGCRFMGRCPHAVDACGTSVPPLYRVGPTQVASCVLHSAKPVLPAAQLTDVLPV
jgi:peptide/nickel transport system ATP-binding protein